MQSAILDKCLPFLHSIGIPTVFEKIQTPTFLPGLRIEKGSILIDRNGLLHPGDILHEAGHIAVIPAADRATLCQQTIETSPNREGEELMAIAWSYAACMHIGLDPHLVFHEEGYKGGGSNIVENFQAGRYFGTPLLQWCGMTLEPRHATSDTPPYPHMIRWLRE